MLHWPNDYTVQRAVYELDAAALHTKHPRENLLGRRGRVPRFVARWHRSRGQFTEGKNITGAPTIEAAKLACERHAEQRTDIP